MILVILVIAIALFVGGLYLNDRSYDSIKEGIGFMMAVIGGFGSLAAGMATVIMICICIGAATIDEKIEVYENENMRIEQDIAAGKHRSSWEYSTNAQKINELEIEKINVSRCRWWLYFGE